MVVVLVTGANRGIGLFLVKELLKRSKYQVYATCRDPDEKASPLVDLQKQASDRMEILGLDVSDKKSIEAALRHVQSNNKWGGCLDILINNAGIASKRHPDVPILEQDPEEFLDIMQTNVVGVMLMNQAFYPLLKKSKQGGKVLNISSSVGSIEENKQGNYGAYRISKAAQNQLTRTFAVELKDVCFYAIHPGHVDTDMGTVGGQKADISPEESADGVIKVMEGLKKESTGQFFNWKGEQMAW